MVEEKSSRVIEVILSAVRPRQLLTGKVIGLGLLALGHLCVIAIVGLVVGAAAGAIHLTASLVGAAALAILWFIAGYAFYSCLFACAGALVPRQEELQSTTMPLTLLILVSFFLSFAVNDNPDGTLAHVTAFLPMTAPLTMPGRIITGDAAGLGGRRLLRDHARRGRGADPARRPDLRGRRAAHRQRGQAARRVAGRRARRGGANVNPGWVGEGALPGACRVTR